MIWEILVTVECKEQAQDTKQVRLLCQYRLTNKQVKQGGGTRVVGKHMELIYPEFLRFKDRVAVPYTALYGSVWVVGDPT